MAWGMFKKVVIADNLSVMVGRVYDHPTEHHGLAFAAATVCFAYQIYCDFSGYCDIALGAAQVMGFTLMENFNRPYFSKSISEFWRRWHISLSTWFRDYVYISLGGNWVGLPRVYMNLFIVFLISGLWHGAKWTFIVWGGIHGFYLIFAVLTREPRAKMAQAAGLAARPRLLNYYQVTATFMLVCLGWIFFPGQYPS